MAKSLCAQCVIAYLEEFAPDGYSIRNLLDETTPRDTPAVLSRTVNIALHFKINGALSARDYVLWDQRIKPDDFIAMSQSHPATGAILGINAPDGLTGTGLFKALWSLNAAFGTSDQAPQSVEREFFKKLLEAIKTSTRKDTISGVKPSTQTTTKPTARMKTPGVRAPNSPEQSVTTTGEPRTTPPPASLRGRRPAAPATRTPVIKSTPKAKVLVERKESPQEVSPSPAASQGQATATDKAIDFKRLTLPEIQNSIAPVTPAPAVAQPPTPSKGAERKSVELEAAPQTTAQSDTAPAPVRPNRDELMDLLMNAKNADWIEITFIDGRSLSGTILFNEFRGTGRLINVDDEFSYDFSVDDVVDVKI